MNKKYILKPGNHQFAPHSRAVHNNNNLSDEEAEWYLEKYPHIAKQFEDIPNEETVIDRSITGQSVESEIKISEIPTQSVKSELNQNQLNEDLSTTN